MNTTKRKRTEPVLAVDADGGPARVMTKVDGAGLGASNVVTVVPDLGIGHHHGKDICKECCA